MTEAGGLRILHVLDHSIPLHSGYAFRTKAIVEHQRRLGNVTFQVTGSKYNQPGVSYEEIDGMDFFRTPRSLEILYRMPVLNQWAVVRDLRRCLEDVIARTKPDILHAHSPCLNGLAALSVGRRLGIPVVYELRALWEDAAVDHGEDTSWGLRYRASRWLETTVLRKAAAVTTICEGLRSDLIARGIPREKIAIVPNAVDVERFSVEATRDDNLAASLNLAPGHVVGFIGSFYRYEGLHILIKAISSMTEQLPDLQVVLVGGGPEETALLELTQELGVQGRVKFTGRVPHDQVQKFYGLMDVMVYPRLATRLTELVTPLKPIEAMALGKAVAASDVGGHRELMRHGDNGILFEAGSSTALAESLVGLLRDRDGSAELAARARSQVLSQRGWLQSTSVYPAVYNRILRRDVTPDS